jgi:hypothetical protein
VYTVAPTGEGNKKIWVLLPFSCGRKGWEMRVPYNASRFYSKKRVSKYKPKPQN